MTTFPKEISRKIINEFLGDVDDMMPKKHQFCDIFEDALNEAINLKYEKDIDYDRLLQFTRAISPIISSMKHNKKVGNAHPSYNLSEVFERFYHVNKGYGGWKYFSVTNSFDHIVKMLWIKINQRVNYLRGEHCPIEDVSRFDVEYFLWS